jgi:hypothetical protein
VVYLIVYRLQDGNPAKFQNFSAKLASLNAQHVIRPYAWLAEYPKSAPELYRELVEELDPPHTDKLFVAEITANSIGSYFIARDDDAAKVAGVVGRARRD